MNQYTQSIQQHKEELLEIIANCLIRYLELERTTDNPEWSPSIMLARLLAGLAASLKRADGPSSFEPIPVTATFVETATIESQQLPIVTESAGNGASNAKNSLPKEDSPEQRLEKHFGPARLPIVTAKGHILEFNLEGCIRFVGPENQFGTISCSKSECEAALALFKANGDGLSNIDLACWPSKNLAIRKASARPSSSVAKRGSRFSSEHYAVPDTPGRFSPRISTSTWRTLLCTESTTTRNSPSFSSESS